MQVKGLELDNFDDLIGQDLLTVCEKDAAIAIARFKDIFTADEALKRKLRARRPIIPDDAQINVDNLQQLVLLDGLVGALTATASELPPGPPCHFEIFVHLFVAFWDRIPERLRKSFQSEILECANDPEKLPAFYFEMAVAAMYWKEGCRVELNDLLKIGAYSNDYNISKATAERSQRFAIEVKTIDWRTGYPFDHDVLQEQTRRLHEFLGANKARFPEYHVVIRLVPGSRSGGVKQQRLEAIDDIDRIIASLKKGNHAVWRQRVHCSVVSKCPRIQWSDPGVKAFLKRGGFITIFKSKDRTQPGVISVIAGRRRDLSVRIGEVMRGSRKRQLDPEEKHVFWFQLVGRRNLTREDELNVLNFFGWNTRVGRDLREQNRVSADIGKGLFCVHIGGDAVATRGQDGLLRYSFPHAILSARGQSAAVLRYRKEIMNTSDGYHFEFRG